MAVLEADLERVDRSRMPAAGDPTLPRYKEWHHFNLIDDATGVDAIVNLSVSGDARTPDRGQANLILLTHSARDGWRGGVDVWDGAALVNREETLDCRLGPSRIAYEVGTYLIDAVLRDGRVGANLRFEPCAEPLLISKDTPVGAGHINWLIVPRLTVSGELIIDDRRIPIVAGRGYHDHNWGAWRWGENFGWDWGFCADACAWGGEPLSLVYDRTTDRAGTRVQEHTLAVWRGKDLAKLFTRRTLQAQRVGRFRGAIERRPAVMGLLRHDMVRSVPERILISARDGEDWLEAEYVVDAALQIAIPNEMDFGAVELNETLGWLTLTGHIGGQAISGCRRTCFEIVC